MSCEEGFKETEIGPIPEDWSLIELKEVLREKGYIRGPFGSSLKRSELKSEGIPVYEQANAINNHRIFRYYIDKQKYDKLKRFAVKENDLIISCSGTFGKVSLIEKEDLKGIISQALLILRTDTKMINPLFLKYFINSDKGYYSISSRSLGSVQVNIAKREIIEKIKFPIPNNRNEQNTIVKVLKAFDDKIELLHETNETLEQIAQALFKHWFIDFEFPDENGKPYRSSGGSMKPSPMGMIPEDWTIESLKDILSTVESGNRPKGGSCEEGIPSIGAENINGLGNYDYSKTKYVPIDYFKNIKRGVVKNRDVLLYKDGASLGRKSMFMENYPFETCCINEHVFILRSKDKISPEYLYFWLDKPEITEEIKNLNANSAQPGINQTSVKSLPIVVPSKNIVTKFTNIVHPLICKICINSLHTQTLSQIRDTLLPRLMSGKIRVPVKEGDEPCQA